MSAEALQQTAHEYISAYLLPKGTMVGHLEIEHAHLLRTFQIFVELGHERIDDETQGPHPSKHLGQPWVPKGFEWPEQSYFMVQLELAKVAPYDLTGQLPKEGLLALFFDPLTKDFGPASPTATKPFVFDTTEGLELLTRPKKSELPQGGKYYEQDFFRFSYALSYEPAFNFKYLDELPDDLVQGLEKELGLTYVKQPSSTVFGKAVTWQGEDDLFTPPEWDWAEGMPPNGESSHLLLFQTSFLEGTFHWWVHRDRLAEGDLSQILTTASVT